MRLPGWFYCMLVRILLVVVAVQALTPDSRSLASFKALNILFNATDFLGDSENTPDEVSGPCRFGEGSADKRQEVRAMDSTLTTGWPDSRAKPCRDRMRYLTEPDGTRLEGALRTHCRLRC
jgi:hypothetical protein